MSERYTSVIVKYFQNNTKTNKKSFLIAGVTIFVLSFGFIFEQQNAYAGVVVPSVTFNIPGDITVDQNTVGGANVVYEVTAFVTARPGDPVSPIDCGPFSSTGGFFPIGTTTVTCTANDPEGRGIVQSPSFDVTVIATDDDPCDDGYCPPVLESATPMGISIELEWTQEKKSIFLGSIDPRGFDIIETEQGLGDVGRADGSDRSFKVNNLEPNTEYCFEIVNDWRLHSDQTSNELCATTGDLGILTEAHCDIDGRFSIGEDDNPNEVSGFDGECTLVYDNGGMQTDLDLEWEGTFEISDVVGECDHDGFFNNNIASNLILTIDEVNTLTLSDQGDMCRNRILGYSLDGMGTVNSGTGIFAGFSGNSESHTTVFPIAATSLGEIWITFSPAPAVQSAKSTSYQDPNLGDVKHGRGHDNGFCMNQNCINVDGFFNHFPETIVPQGSTQAFTVLVNCPRGANTCNHISLAGALPDADFYDDRWTVTTDRIGGTENWDLTIMNDYEEINEDAVVVTVQTVGQSFVTATFNIPFVIPGSIGTHDGVGVPHDNNRHLHVTVWDNAGGISNYIFNEGIYVDDIYSYPQIETSFEEPLEYEQLCLNEDSTKRHTCAFEKVKQWTIKNAEEKLKEIYDTNNYKPDSEQN